MTMSISSFFWHPVVGFAMLNCKMKKNRTFVLDVREWGEVEQMRLQMKITQKEEVKLKIEIMDNPFEWSRCGCNVRDVLSLRFCMMCFGEVLCGFFFLGFGFFPDEWGQGPNLNKWSLSFREIRHQ